MELENVLAGVGPRLREVRQGRGLTLAEVAERTGLSVSTLSRLESGGRRPSLDLLLPLAGVYRVPLDDLVGAPPTGDPRIHPRPVRRHGMVFIPLSRNGGDVQAVKIILPGREPGTPIEQRSHTGYEWLYVLSGPVDLALGPDVTTLATGEAAEFDTRTPHGLVSGSRDPAEVIALLSTQGERIHLGPPER